MSFRSLCVGGGKLTRRLVQQIPVGGVVCLIWETLCRRGMSQGRAGLPFISSASTLAPLPLVHLRVSKCKAEWHERPAGPESS